MARDYLRVPAWAVLSTVGFAIVGSLAAQETVASAERDVVIAVRVPDRFSREELETRFKLALESAQTKAELIQAKPIELETYEQIKEFLTSVKAGGDLNRKGILARRSTKSNYWDIYLPDGYNQVDKLNLEYRDKGNGTELKKAEFKPVSRAQGEKSPSERLIYLGLAPPQLELRADPKWELTRYTLHLKAWGDKPARVVTDEFVGERCFRVEIIGY